MLHSDLAQRARRDGRSPVLQESAAVEVARLMKDDPSHHDFARRWYEAMASLAEAETRWAEALAWAERGLRDFPESVEMRLVQASIEETQAVLEQTQGDSEAALERNETSSIPTRGGAGPSFSTVARSASTSRAPNAPCARSLAVDASLPEPRLRLGRVAWRLGETADARSALLDVLGPQAGRHDGVPRPPVPRPARRGRRPARRGRWPPTRPRWRSTRAPSRRGSPSATCACVVETRRAPARRSRRRSARRAAARSPTRSGSIPGVPPSESKTGSRRCAGRPRRDRASRSCSSPPRPCRRRRPTFTVGVEGVYVDVFVTDGNRPWSASRRRTSS